MIVNNRMRVSHKFKIIFLSNPKTGSTSVRKILNKYSEIKSGITDKNLFHHLNALKAKKYFEENNIDIWYDYVSITTIRNPFERAVSNYFYSKPDKYGIHFYQDNYDESTIFEMDFNKWLKTKIEIHGKVPGLISFEEFCCDENGNCIVDYVIPIEKIDIELPKLLKRLGINYNDNIPRSNKTSHKRYQFYFNDESRKLIEEKYKKDIEIGGYVF